MKMNTRLVHFTHLIDFILQLLKRVNHDIRQYTKPINSWNNKYMENRIAVSLVVKIGFLEEAGVVFNLWLQRKKTGNYTKAWGQKLPEDLTRREGLTLKSEERSGRLWTAGRLIKSVDFTLRKGAGVWVNPYCPDEKKWEPKVGWQ